MLPVAGKCTNIGKIVSYIPFIIENKYEAASYEQYEGHRLLWTR
jgi:hypothetical protein